VKQQQTQQQQQQQSVSACRCVDIGMKSLDVYMQYVIHIAAQQPLLPLLTSYMNAVAHATTAALLS
jgi:hypothetical protein